jgi:hypothetical protein
MPMVSVVMACSCSMKEKNPKAIEGLISLGFDKPTGKHQQ